MKKRYLSIVLALSLLLTLAPAWTLAADTQMSASSLQNSTQISIRSETLNSQTGNHTISAEFRTQGDSNESGNSSSPDSNSNGDSTSSESRSIASGTCGETLTWSLCENGVLTISGRGEMTDYSQNTHAPWYEHRSAVKSVVLEDGVTSVGDFAFDSCASLTDVSFSEKTTSVGLYAFRECSGLNSITLPEKLTVVKSGLFWDCTNLSEVELPDSVTEIQNSAFYNCSALTNVTIPNSVTSVGVGAFTNCVSLGSMTIPEAVTSVGMGLFDGCQSLSSVTIPKSVSSVGNIAFRNCGNLKDVYFAGSEADWGKVSIGTDNDPLRNATFHFADDAPDASAEPASSDSLPSGIKYVPYSHWLLEDGSSTARIQILSGTLPSGLTLNSQTGELRGVPMAAGTWEFMVDIGTASPKTFTLFIQDSADPKVTLPQDYTILDPIGEMDPEDPSNYILEECQDSLFRIDGPFQEFTELYIDGQRLTRDVDYTAVEGSTAITIKSNTLQRMGLGKHTIAADFREGGKKNGKLKKVAQHYTLKSLKGATAQDPNAQAQQGMHFTDVKESDWFYGDVKFNYDGALMKGVSDTLFAPQRAISQATIVTVLARLAKADLSQFEGAAEEGIQPGQQYTAAAIWAKRSGLLPEGQAFTGAETTTRDQMAIMLVKYLRSMNKDAAQPEQPVAFADAAQMSQEGNEAFQVLYKSGVFKGVGDLRMNPEGSTTRAHFSALIHRIANLK